MDGFSVLSFLITSTLHSISLLSPFLSMCTTLVTPMRSLLQERHRLRADADV
jgi:hypothetical protein